MDWFTRFMLGFSLIFIHVLLVLNIFAPFIRGIMEDRERRREHEDYLRLKRTREERGRRRS